MRQIRCFISSPGDVGEERLLSVRVVERLQREFAQRVELQPIVWEHEPLRATSHFQSQLIPPAQTDLVLCILWSRLGTRLPGEFRRPDGTEYASGTEWEFENAAEAYRTKGTPDLLVYRKTSDPVARLTSKETVLQQLAQKEALDRFIDRWFGNPAEGFRAAFHTFRTADEFERLAETHLRRFLHDRLGAAPVVVTGPKTGTWHRGSPFRGLSPFDVDHADVFFGRTRAVADLKGHLERQAARGSAFVLVVGMSGSGKSSLVRAGLVPTLTQPGVVEGIGLWRYGVVRPGDVRGDLCDGLGEAIHQGTALPHLSSLGFPANKAAALLRADASLLVGPLESALQSAARQVAEVEKLSVVPAARLLLVMDQLEESFSGPERTAAERETFVAALATLARSGLVWVVATLRSDFFARLAELPDLVELKAGDGQFDVLAPSFGEIEQMISYPARVAGVSFEFDPSTQTSLHTVIHEAASRDPQSLPLLQFTLDELYKRRSEDVLTFSAYRQLGGLEGAIAQRAEEVFSSLGADLQGALPDVLHGLIVLSEDHPSAATSRRAALSQIAPTQAARELVESFVTARLMVIDRGTGDEKIVGLAHEALLRHWPRILAWITENQELLRVRQRVASAAEQWEREGRNSDFLLAAGKPLADAEALVARRLPLPDKVHELVRQSAGAARRAVRRRRLWIAGTAAAFLLVSLAFGVYSFIQWIRTDQLRLVALDRQAYAEKQESVARQRQREADEQRSVAETALERESAALEAEQEHRAAKEAALVKEQEQRRIAEEALARESKALAAEQQERQAKEAALAEEIRQRRAKDLALQQAEFNLLFRNVALADHDWQHDEIAGARQWLAGTPTEMRRWEWYHVARKCFAELQTRPLGQPGDYVACLGFSPRGARLIAAAVPLEGRPVEPWGEDETVPAPLSVWNWDTGQLEGEFRRHTAPPEAAVLLERGETAASASLREILLWQVADEKVLHRIALPDETQGVALSGNGQYAAAVIGMGNGSAFDLVVWNIAQEQETARWHFDSRFEQDLVLSYDGSVAAVAHDRQRFVVFRQGSDSPLLQSPADDPSSIHRTIFALDLNYDASRAAVGRYDGSVEVWSLGSSTSPKVLPGSASAVGAVRFMPGDKLLTAGWDNAIRVWDLVSEQQVHTLRGHDDWVMAVDVSSSGNTLASGSRDGEWKLWTLRSDERAAQIFPAVGFNVQGLGWDATGRKWFAAVAAETGLTLRTGELATNYTFDDGSPANLFCAVSADGKMVASAGTSDEENDVLLWRPDGRGFETAGVLKGHTASPNCGCFCGDRFVSGGWDDTVRVWQVETQELLATVTLDSPVWAVAADAVRGTIYAGVRSGTIAVIDVASGAAIRSLEPGWPVMALALAPDGGTLAAGGGWRDEPAPIQVWDLESGLVSHVLHGHSDPVTCLAYHPDGQRLASGSNDRSVRIWDVAHGLEALSLHGHRREIQCLAFDRSGGKLATAGWDGTVIVWDGTPVKIHFSGQ